ncbi:deoxyribodipyrimidine photo-lyase [Rhodophyticola sp. CCM32]|uniref:cryptochrome/photolyase family protein n=1 Tax=Rhodophyticola sp. CCM32 TaxID=2916397 RepID=UPI00107F3C74|nr:deoxyribodipyrimidine photo-lyase [Rhodophyticola sp. CCM32]QBY02676.1 deoxyribodipyrimidine photo-lyase [Rhodophyticola sp. CCM32]
MTPRPIIYWMRRDFRLADNPALVAACASRRPVIPVFILDEVVEGHKPAPKWRLALSVTRFAEVLAGQGGRLILRRGRALDVLRALVAETGAGSVHWARLYDPDSKARDEAVKAGLKADELEAVSHPGHVVFEPWTVQTGTGGFYRVYSPFWRAVRGREVAEPLAVPKLNFPEIWPASDDLADWHMAAAMGRGAGVVRPHLTLGEAAAQDRLDRFLDSRIGAYKVARDFLDQDATSGLSEPLAYGEISARVCWHAGQGAMLRGEPGAEHFLKELIWRDFAYHLVFHTPHITHGNWRAEWDGFPWRGDNSEAEAWRRGRTGLPVIDAALREMYVTGRMHNRARMLVASYLTKHLMTDWRIGRDWFEACLVDWDPASNAMGWQWVAGSGPDAAPYFRIFNPETQSEKFDQQGLYRRKWVAELSADPGAEALSYFEAIPQAWGMGADDPYPEAPVVGLAEGRARALSAYENRGF